MEVIPYFETDFGTLGTSLRKFDTSLRKFGTSNLRATETLSIFPWSILSFEDHQVVIGGRSLFRNKLWHLWHILYKISYILHKIWYIQSLSYYDPYLITYGSFIPLGIFGSDWRSFPTLKWTLEP